MRWGMGWSCPWGDPETWIITLKTQDFRTGASQSFYSVFSQFYQLIIDGKYSGVPVYVAAGSTATLSGSYFFENGPHTICIVGVGQWAMPNAFDVTPVQVDYLAPRASRIHMEIIAVPEQFGAGSGIDQFTSWSVTGIQRFTNCYADKDRPTWGMLDLALSVNAGVYTLEASIHGLVVASGSRTGAGTITLTEQNDSGIAGSVVFAPNGGIVAVGSSQLVTAWPAQYYVYYRLTTPWTAPFGTPTAIMYDDGRSSTFSFDTDKLPSGTYYVVVHQLNEDLVESTSTVNQTVPIVVVPRAPTSFTAANGTTFGGNYLRYTQDLMFAGVWASTNLTGSFFFTAPDATNTAYLFNETAAFGQHRLNQVPPVGLPNGTYTFSFYAKYGGSQWIAVSAHNPSEGNHVATFDVLNGVIGTTQINTTSVAMTSVGSGWYRCSVTFFAGSSLDLVTLFCSNGDDASFNIGYAGNPARGVYAWGAQLQDGSVATTYIHNTSSINVVADILSFTASPDTSSTYNIYDSAELNCINTTTTLSRGAGTGTLTYPLPSISPTYTGNRYVFARAVLAGIESGNSSALTITYSNGSIVTVRATAPQVNSIDTLGRKLTVGFTLDMLNQPNAPSSVQLFTSLTTTFNYAAPLATLSIPPPADVTYDVSAATWTGGIATVTIGAHAIQVGDRVTVYGINPIGYNGLVRVTAITGTQIKYARAINPGTYVASANDHVRIKGTGRFVLGSINGTVGANGLYYFALRAVGSNGQSLNTDYVGPIRLSTVVPNDPVLTARGGV